MKNDDKMGTKNILPLLVEFSIPAIIGMLVNAIYNIVDRMFIGNAPELGAIGLAGISICYPVTLILMAISLMIGMGGATRFSIALGQGKKAEAGKYMGNGLTLTIILGLVFMILGNVFLAPMLRLLGASKTVLPYAENYLSIILYGAVFQCIAMAGNNFSRAQGNPKNAMISQLYFPYGNARSCFCNDWWTVFKCFMATCIFIWKKNDYSFKCNFIEITVEYFKTNYSNRNTCIFNANIE